MQEFELPFRLYGCKLDKARLDRLVSIATDGFPPAARLTVSSRRGITDFSNESLEKLLHEMGSPDRLHALNIRIRWFSAGETEETYSSRSVFISVSSRSVWGNVSGTDETWVRGRIDQIRTFLRGTRVALAINPIGAGFLPHFAIWIVSFGVSGALLAGAGRAITLILGAAALVLGMAGGWWFGRRSRSEIVLAGGDRPPWTRDNKIALSAVVVAVVGVLASLLALHH